MEERDYDVIVVGGGCAGSIGAYVAAKRGKSVLLVERGESAGAKSMSGGRIYAHSLRSVLDAYPSEGLSWDDIPFERKITREHIALIDPTASTDIGFTSEDLAKAGQDSYSVLRGTFDPWLLSLAEDAGCDVVCGIPVEKLMRDGGNGAVIGISAGGDDITAQVVIDAEGANSLLAERELGAPRPQPNQMAVGIKEVFELPSSVIEDRFLCPEGEGAAMLFVGDCTHGNVGGGFLYTNRESISLGLVATIKELSESSTTIYQAMEDFKCHPAVAPIIKGAKVVEHSGHMVPEGGYNMVPKYAYDGCLIAGDAAMICMNLGYQVRGMDFAVASGRFAAEAACDAIDSGDVSEAGLASYGQKMEGSFVLQDMKTFRAWPATMESWDRMFTEYPALVRDILNGLFVVDGQPQKHLGKRLWPVIKQRGLWQLVKEVRGALKAL